MCRKFVSNKNKTPDEFFEVDENTIVWFLIWVKLRNFYLIQLLIQILMRDFLSVTWGGPALNFVQQPLLLLLLLLPHQSYSSWCSNKLHELTISFVELGARAGRSIVFFPPQKSLIEWKQKRIKSPPRPAAAGKLGSRVRNPPGTRSASQMMTTDTRRWARDRLMRALRGD